MIINPVPLRRRSARSMSTTLNLSDIQDGIEASYFRDIFSSSESRRETDSISLIENMDSSFFRAVKLNKSPENDENIYYRIKLEILPASDLILTDSVEFLLEIPDNYPSIPPIVTCLTKSKDTLSRKEFIDRDGVNLPLFRSDIAWRSSYKLDVVAYALRRIFLRTDLEPWELTCSISEKDNIFQTSYHCATTGGHFSSIGSRSSMEDAHAMKEGLSSPILGDLASNTSFYAIFDGHGGDSCSKFAANRFESTLKSALSKSEENGFVDWSRALCLTLRDIDRAYIRNYEGRGRTGSTAVCVVFNGKDRLFTANLGDSRAVLCRDQKALNLTQDCKASRSDEIARIVANGGFINNGRVRGQLAVSRSLGDASYKSSRQMLVSRDAEITEIKLNENDSFLIVACDGLWDVMSSQQAVDFVFHCFNSMRNVTVETVAKKLVLHAINELHATDNVSATVVKIGVANSHLITPKNDVQLTEVPENLATTPPIYPSNQTGPLYRNSALRDPPHCKEAFPLGDMLR